MQYEAKKNKGALGSEAKKSNPKGVSGSKVKIPPKPNTKKQRVTPSTPTPIAQDQVGDIGVKPQGSTGNSAKPASPLLKVDKGKKKRDTLDSPTKPMLKRPKLKLGAPTSIHNGTLTE